MSQLEPFSSTHELITTWLVFDSVNFVPFSLRSRTEFASVRHPRVSVTPLLLSVFDNPPGHILELAAVNSVRS